MNAHIVPESYLVKWANSCGKESLYLFDKKIKKYRDKVNNARNVFGKPSYYYLKLFIKASLNNTDGEISGRQMWMTETINKAFPSFFLDLDKTDFKNYKFIEHGKEINNKSFRFVSQCYCCNEDRVKVYDSHGNALSQKRIMNIINNHWMSAKYKKIIEDTLSIFEGKISDWHNKLISALENNDLKTLDIIHDNVSFICAVQQSRIPENKLPKQSIDLIVNSMNVVALNRGRPDLVQKLKADDYKEICLVQLLHFVSKFKNKLNPNPRDLGESIVDTLIERYKMSSFFYLKATNDHKFVIGDDPLLLLSMGKRGAMALPVSPNYCLLALGTGGNKIYNRIINAPNKIIDYINQKMYESSEIGVVSVDKKYVCKDRNIEPSDFESMFKKLGFAFIYR